MSTVVITGSAAGLGRVIAERVAAQGYDLALVDCGGSELLDVAEDIGRRHVVAVKTIVGDLASGPGIQSVVDGLQRLTNLKALVNNAGGWSSGDQYPEATREMWTATMMLNLLAPMTLTHHLWGALATGSGAVVNVGSSGGLGDGPYGSPEYGAAKAGLRRFTTSLGSRRDVRVMTVVPGWIGLERAHSEFAALSAEEQLSHGPLVPPETVADTVVRLIECGFAGEVVEILN